MAFTVFISQAHSTPTPTQKKAPHTTKPENYRTKKFNSTLLVTQYNTIAQLYCTVLQSIFNQHLEKRDVCVISRPE